MNIQEFRRLTGLEKCTPKTFEFFNQIYMRLSDVTKEAFCAAVADSAIEYESKVSIPAIERMRSEIAKGEKAVNGFKDEAIWDIQGGMFEAARSCIRCAEEREKEIADIKSALMDAAGFDS